MTTADHTIWKYPLELTERQEIELPKGAQILHIADQDGQLTMWAQVDPTKESGWLQLTVVGTGHQIPLDAGEHFGTVQQPPYVWHIFGLWVQR